MLLNMEIKRRRPRIKKAVIKAYSTQEETTTPLHENMEGIIYQTPTT